MPTIEDIIPLTVQLRNLANKIRGAWGQHPDADMADAAAARIEELEQEVTDLTPTTTARKAK